METNNTNPASEAASTQEAGAVSTATSTANPAVENNTSENQTATPTEPAKTPDPITDEVLLSEISKRYGDKIKTKEDFDRIMSFNESEYIKPKNQYAKALNDWHGDLDTFVKVQSLDVEKMDNKSAIIQNMMIKEGLTEEIANIKFNKMYGDAFKTETDEGYNENEKKLAEFQLMKDAGASKEALSQWKTSTQEQGSRNHQAQDEATRMATFEKEWLSPVKQAVDGLQKLSLDVKYTLPDKTEVSEPFHFEIDNPESNKAVLNLLSSGSTEDFMKNFITRYGTDEKGNFSFPRLAQAVAYLENKTAVVQKAMEVGASKSLSSHLDKIKPGNLQNEKQVTMASGNKSHNEMIIEAFNKDYSAQVNKK